MKRPSRFWSETEVVLEAALAYGLVEILWQRAIPGIHWFAPFVCSFLVVRILVAEAQDAFPRPRTKIHPAALPSTPVPKFLKDISGLPDEVSDLREWSIDDAVEELEVRSSRVDPTSRTHRIYTVVVNRLLSEIERRDRAASDKA